MITYKIASSDEFEIVLKMRRECCACVFGRDESAFDGEFMRISREYFANSDQTTVLAFDGEKAEAAPRAVGCATMCYITLMPTLDHPTGKRAHVMNVYTNPNYRRLGIGRKMMEMLIDEARERGVTHISLDATPDGAKLYKSLGFKYSNENMEIIL